MIHPKRLLDDLKRLLRRFEADLRERTSTVAELAELLVAALQASKLTTLRHAPGFRLNVAVGDSLLHGRRFEELDLKGEMRHSGRAEGSSGTRMASKTWRISTTFWGSSTMWWWGIHPTSRLKSRG